MAAILLTLSLNQRNYLHRLQIQVQNGQFSSAPCFLSEQQRLDSFASLSYIETPEGFTNLIVSPDQPTVEQQDALWLQTDDNNNPIQFFTFSSLYAAWVWPHPTPPNDERLVLFRGDAGDVDALDGGNSNAVTDTDGPFWSIHSEFSNLIPIGAGTVPVETNAFEFATGTNYPQVRGVYFLERTARKFFVP